MSNLTLIGMPGAGKTVIGNLLATELEYPLVDTDVLIEARYGSPLQEILEQYGYKKLREIEAEEILGLTLEKSVIATGGSAVYNEEAMTFLKSTSTVVFLDITLATLKQRVNNFSQRGISRAPGQSLDLLYKERLVLYQKYSEFQVTSDGKTPKQVLAEILHFYLGKKN